MIGELPTLAHDPAALVVGTTVIVGGVVGLGAWLWGFAAGWRAREAELERWQRRRP